VWKNTSDDVSQSMINFPDIETSVNEEGKEIAG
jgi:hypothetical protein